MRTAAVVIWILAAAAVTWATSRGPDAGGYSATDEAVSSFIDLSATGAASVLAGADDETATLTLPFPFRFYGQLYSLACASVNGSLHFVASVGDCGSIVDFANTDLTATTTPGNWPALLPLWSDLTFDAAAAGSVLYQTLGPAGARKFVVEWHNAMPLGSSTPVTFQLVLSEGSNEALFQYKTIDLGPTNAATRGRAATVGIRNANGLTTGEQIQWSFGAPVLANDSAIRFGSGDSTPPSMACAVTPTEIWPPNNAMVPVRATVTVTDTGSGPAGFTLQSVVSSESAAAGDITGFLAGTPDVEGQVRARRNGSGSARVYRLTYEGRDAAGNTATCAVTVTVPHDRRR